MIGDNTLTDGTAVKCGNSTSDSTFDREYPVSPTHVAPDLQFAI